MKIIKSLILIILLLISCIIIFPLGHCEETNNEDTEMTYLTIQESIDVALEGDIVYVYGGVYYEDIIINKSLNLRGKILNSYKPVILGNITITANNVNIFNLTIQESAGINLKLVDYVNISGNKIKDCQVGISLQNVSYINIFENIIENNSEYGIYFLENENDHNTIFHNNFINNTVHASNGGQNNWFHPTLKEGNYWDDYKGLDENDDGIGDVSYTILGGNDTDQYPLMQPYDGEAVIDNEFTVNENAVLKMLVVGIILSAIFCLPIGLWWRKKYFR